MRVVTHRTKKGLSYYIIRDVTKANGIRSTETLEDLGTEEEIMERHQCDNARTWAEAYAAELTEKDPGRKILVPYSPTDRIAVNNRQSFDTGYLFLQQIYYDLRMDLICKHIQARHAFQYDLNDILAKLIYGRILYPSSKLSTYKQSANLLEAPKFKYHHVPRALSVIAEEFDTIQAELYEYSKKVIPRKTHVLYYDCTNFFFEIEQEDGIENKEADEQEIAARKYGFGKDHKPNPLVQMGLFMDYSGIPLAISINRGSRNEQTTLIPLEEKIMRDFELSRFVVCTDAALSSEPNRMFNNFGERSFITTVSIKGMKKEMTDWCLETDGWKLPGDEKNTYDITQLEATDDDREKYYDKTFYKLKYIEGYDDGRDIEFNQTLIVTFSLKYRDYQKKLREGHVQRAQDAINAGSSKIERKGTNDFRRFIDREIVLVKEKKKGRHKSDDSKEKENPEAVLKYKLDQVAIDEEARFDGLYAVETNLDDDVSEILKITHGRWEIEESFRIMKHDFEARPVYLTRNERIKAHFMTCFMALLVYRVLERKLGENYTCEEILHTLRSMRMTKAKDIGYVPAYTRTKLTDALHDTAGFYTDCEIIRDKAMKGILRTSKQRQS